VRLRTFLLKRAVHTIITLLVVLVLLFIIFRLMPGDPTRFFIEPGQTQDTRDRLLVKFGFRQWVDAPGTYREASIIQADQPGAYLVTINVVDEAGNTVQLHATYNVDVSYALSATDDPLQIVATVDPLLISEFEDGGVEFFNEPPERFGAALVDESVTVYATFGVPPPPGVEVRADVTYISSNGTSEDFMMDIPFTLSGQRYTSGPMTPDKAGHYDVAITARDPVGNDSITVHYAFAANLPDSQIAPFSLIEEEGEIFTYIDEFDSARVSVAVKSDDAKILNEAGIVVAEVVRPDSGVDHIDMYHPEVTEERNIFEQFWVYFTSMLQLDFGKSFYSQRPVWTEIQEKAPPTILLFGTSLILQAVFGVLIGVMLAWRRGTRLELSAVVVALFFYSMPLFWFGIILIWAFAFQLGWFPFGGMVTPELWADGPPDIWTQITDIGSHMILPLITLMMVGLAFTILLMRNSMLEVLGEDYITTAKAKGLSERKVMYKHAARNAMLPVVTVIAISVGGVVSGGVLTETIFSWPGMGFYLVQSTLQQDYPAVQGVFFLLAVLTILANVAADVLYAFMDPRVRL
jgi:peptide/nickel transport system permease protein